MIPYSIDNLVLYLKNSGKRDQKYIRIVVGSIDVLILVCTTFLGVFSDDPYWGFLALGTILPSIWGFYLDSKAEELCSLSGPKVFQEGDRYKELQKLYNLYDQYRKSSIVFRLRSDVEPWMLEISEIWKYWENYQTFNAFNNMNCHSKRQRTNISYPTLSPKGAKIEIKIVNRNYKFYYNDVELPDNWTGITNTSMTPNWINIPDSNLPQV